MFKFTEVATCRGSVADCMDHNNPNVVKRSVQGDLQVLLETTTGMLLLKMKDFQYGINPNDQIWFDDRDPRFKLMICLDSNPQNTWVLKVNDNSELLFYVINERCRVIHTRASRMIVDQLRNQNKNIPQIPQYPQLQDPKRLQYNPQVPQGPQST